MSGAGGRGELVKDAFGDDGVSAERSLALAAAIEAEQLRDRALRLLAVGVGDHTPIEVREQVAEIARRLAQLEPSAHELG
jgi:hypothetical protein